MFCWVGNRLLRISMTRVKCVKSTHVSEQRTRAACVKHVWCSNFTMRIRRYENNSDFRVYQFPTERWGADGFGSPFPRGVLACQTAVNRQLAGVSGLSRHLTLFRRQALNTKPFLLAENLFIRLLSLGHYRQRPYCRSDVREF